MTNYISKRYSIMNEKALELFIKEFGKKDYDLRVVKLRKDMSEPDFYWADYVGGKPVLSVVLQVKSGKGPKASEIAEGEFVYSCFDENNLVEMKDIEKISDRVYMSNLCQQRFKVLRVFEEKKAREVLGVGGYKLDFAIIRSGFDCFPAFIDLRGEISQAVTIWDAKPVPIGDVVKIYKPGDIILGGLLKVINNPQNGDLRVSWET